ncbi:BTB/POZ and MATH domain-containing protein 2-like [Triticum dicoccoides]|uniref:BTB/POZ and MATH domain-containing protein 2-like n=1 Tax=Triticum dicoccoides TaxID=85692 RepID=UPI001890B8C0|nr:BTB/POZ and MATH domain-containing protein 2-like [Triticum dicoccoides]
MDNAPKTIASVVRSVQLVKVDGFSLTRTMGDHDCIKYRWSFDGYEWEIRVYPNCWSYSVRVDLAFLSKPRRAGVKRAFLRKARRGSVRVALSCRLVDPTGNLEPSNERSNQGVFSHPKEFFSILNVMGRSQLENSGYLRGDSFTVQCIVNVLKELPDSATDPVQEAPVPSPDLHRHLADLLQSKTGADVTFLVSGESFAAHKLILAARSPVFMAEFFGDMKEKCAARVEIKDMQAAVFKALLHFIYTDTVAEFAEKGEEVTVLTQHLLAAADRYGLDRLKLICEGKLSGGINVDIAATSLALAEEHNCPQLKAKCVQFIIRNRDVLDAVLASEGYKYLAATCPLVLADLLKLSLRVGENSDA